MLYNELDNFKRGKKDAYGMVKSKDVEVARLNKKVRDLERKLQELEAY